MKVEFTLRGDSRETFILNGSVRPLHVHRRTWDMAVDGIRCLSLMQDDGDDWHLRPNSALGARIVLAIPRPARTAGCLDTLKQTVLGAVVELKNS